jgi:toxin ParE1/3/4
LIDNPRSGRVVPEIENPDMRELIYRGYRIVCGLKVDVLEILAVFEGHRLLRPNESVSRKSDLRHRLL